MVNNDAIRLLEWFMAGDGLHDPFFGHHKALEKNVRMFKELRDRVQAGPVSGDKEFQRKYSSFYVMRYLSREEKEAYFNYMDFLRERNDLGTDISDVVFANGCFVSPFMQPFCVAEELSDVTGKYYVSFVTKMMNLLAPKVWPIYDSLVATVFQKPMARVNDNFVHKLDVYLDIVDTYRELIRSGNTATEAFRMFFNCPWVSDVNVLDALFWTLGKVLCADGRDLSPAEFLDGESEVVRAFLRGLSGHAESIGE